MKENKIPRLTRAENDTSAADVPYSPGCERELDPGPPRTFADAAKSEALKVVIST
jgi:hypothetical protein